jgi:[methyl-Co(III) methanol-specific corrinoid protein]:coenzyme M methyltransferase
LPTPLQRLNEILKGNRDGEKLCACPLQTVTEEQMDQVGAYWPEAHYNPNQVASLGQAAHDIIGFDSVRIPFDLCVEAEAFGCTIKLGARNNQPMVDKSVFNEYSEYKVPEDIWQRGRFQTVFEASDILMSRLGDKYPVFAMAVGPVTLAGYLFGLEKTLMDISLAPEEYKRALFQVSDFTIEYANKLLEHTNGTVVIPDPSASGDLVSPKQFSEFYANVYRRMHEGIKGKVILHICGNTTGMLPDISTSGFEGFSFQGPEVDIRKTKEIVHDKIALVGNVPTIKCILQGTPDDVKKWSIKSLNDGIDVLAPACGIPPTAKISNVKPMVEATKEFNASLR